ncbi:MAG: tetratricopeptide repeat-containing serine protease family protein [Gallionella sp.]|nr:tetratricopeptide repeat-containing serine protease family protein [Gallionella sp.]
MKALSISLLAVLLLSLASCGDKPAGNKTEATVSAVPAVTAVTAKELTPEEKLTKLQKDAEAGDAKAQFNLGVMYTNGEGVPKDGVKAFEWFQKSSLQGNVHAQAYLGKLYSVGWGISKDIPLAFDLLQKAAEQGEGNAQMWLGNMYRFGDGVPKNAVKAMEWYVKAADQGNANAQESIGSLYFKGEGVTKDIAKATEWFDKTGTTGDATFKFQLGAGYQYGISQPKNPVKAFEWYLKAAEGGHVLSYGTVGMMYDKGEGVPKDNAKAFEWWQKAAAQGDADAQSELGNRFHFGKGISKNDVLAYAWSNLAAAQKSNYQIANGANKKLNEHLASFGDKQEKDRAFQRDVFEGVLTPAQRAEGQRLASNWKKGDILQASSGDASGSISPDGKPSKKGTGTAFAVSSAGHALTNNHIIEGCTEVKVAGREGIAKVITSDSVNDLALLQLPGKSKDIASFNPEPGKLRQGDDIIVFGYPLNSVLSSGGNLTPGTLSALTGLGNNTNQIQITAPIQPGSSGSPVMDQKGNVVGVVSMKLDDSKMAKATGSIGQNVNFAVNGQTVRAFLDANQVPYKTGGSLFSREKSNADIAEEARKWTVLVECWK